MNDTYQNTIQFLLAHAGASIRYRVKKEILGTISQEEATQLQTEIMGEPISQLIVKCQKENGWLGNGSDRRRQLGRTCAWHRRVFERRLFAGL